MTVVYTTVICMNEVMFFFKISKLFEFSGFKTKMVSYQSFKYLKNEKINFSKVILKLECLFYQNIHIYYLSQFYSNK